MTETLAALFLAHVLADYVFQSAHMATQKSKLDMLFLHFLVVLTTLFLATGNPASPVLYALALTHIAIDTLKTRLFGDSFAPHVIDQLAHLLSLLLFASAAPQIWTDGIYAGHDWLPETMLLTAGLIYATRAGGFAVGKLMAPFSPRLTRDSLDGGGQLIGLLERGLIFGLMIAGMPAGIGFLVAAKSVLRFETIQGTDASDSRQMAEYVIIGTLASFGWAIAVSLMTLAGINALNGLPLLEIIAQAD